MVSATVSGGNDECQLLEARRRMQHISWWQNRTNIATTIPVQATARLVREELKHTAGKAPVSYRPH